MADDIPAQVPECEGVQHKSPQFATRRATEKAEQELTEAGAVI